MTTEPAPDATPQPSGKFAELERTCFVIMPFGKKEVGGKEVDFNFIYKEIFEPAIERATTPEKGNLLPARTDMDAFSGSIDQDMFEYIMYSRLAFADISGFNPNVFYEIGARHSAQESGTVIFRQTGHAIPFDINSIKIFEYDYESDEGVEASRDFITTVLSNTLKRNRLDSPVRLALRAQWSGSSGSSPGGESSPQGASALAAPAQSAGSPAAPCQADTWRKAEVEKFMRDAEEAIRIDDLDMARVNYWGALRFDPLNTIARMRLGLVLKSQGKNYEALEEFATVTKLAPNYGEAWKEKGVVEGQISRVIPARKRPRWLPDGFDSLTRATMLVPGDFDAWSSLGGVLKNVRQDLAGALKMYSHAAEISDGHPYPLLNAMKLEALHTGELDLESVREPLERAEALRLAQARTTPPTDTPWCFFDLAEIQLYQGETRSFLEFVEQGVASCTMDWQPKTFRDSLKNVFVAQGIEFEGLTEGIARLEQAIADLA